MLRVRIVLHAQPISDNLSRMVHVSRFSSLDHELRLRLELDAREGVGREISFDGAKESCRVLRGGGGRGGVALLHVDVLPCGRGASHVAEGVGGGVSVEEADPGPVEDEEGREDGDRHIPQDALLVVEPQEEAPAALVQEVHGLGEGVALGVKDQRWLLDLPDARSRDEETQRCPPVDAVEEENLVGEELSRCERDLGPLLHVSSEDADADGLGQRVPDLQDGMDGDDSPH
mmetsp:Transcript_31289/g.70445  ORF Transcript_31289/g.70445 Transcript_31289/m.70445 type:complete len:231 (+) Transcript_31289:357-1049(+)